MSEPVKRAAVGLVQRDGKFLCVWNKRYGGWAFPGGKVEDGERVEYTLQRELLEETGIVVRAFEEAYDAPHGVKVESTRGSHVHVFRVDAWQGEPRECEAGSPVTWFTREEFLKWSPFAAFYEKMFAALEKSA